MDVVGGPTDANGSAAFAVVVDYSADEGVNVFSHFGGKKAEAVFHAEHEHNVDLREGIHRQQRYGIIVDMSRSAPLKMVKSERTVSATPCRGRKMWGGAGRTPVATGAYLSFAPCRGVPVRALLQLWLLHEVKFC